jgi:hypothetical protein
MTDNLLSKISQPISAKLSNEEISYQITTMLNELKYIYSYLIYAKYSNNTLSGWIIEYNLSQYDDYNTLNCFDISKDIIAAIINSRNVNKSVIAYKQPAIELMLQLYEPLIHKLALEQSNRWQDLEYEDAVIMCQLVMIKLYQKGYYLHKRLVRKSFENEVLMLLRKSKNKPEIYSFEQVIKKDGDNADITLADVVPDKEAELKAERQEEEEIFNAIFAEVKSIIIELIGERQFEQLLRDYGNKHTTPWSRKKMQEIKRKFNSLGITFKSLGGIYD